MSTNSMSIKSNEWSKLLMNNNSPVYSPSIQPRIHSVPQWQIWRTRSPWYRFFFLILISCIPFGGHFVKNGMSALEPLMLSDASFPITNTMYGALTSAVSVPSMFLPLFGGRYLDTYGHRSIRIFLVWICIGQVIFATGMQLHLFSLAVFGRLFFGLGEGSVVVGTRVFIARWFPDEELTFAMGTCVAVANVSKMLAKATVAPVAMYFGSYVNGLWYGGVVCAVSVVTGTIVCYYTVQLKQIVRAVVRRDECLSPSLTWLNSLVRYKELQYISGKHISSQDRRRYEKEMSCDSISEFSWSFWVVAMLHVVFITVLHLFQNVSSSYLHERYGYSVVKAGIVSSISHSCVIAAPFIGLIIDRFGGRLYVMVFSCMLAILAYVLMIFTTVNPIVSMLMISTCLAITPTILIAIIPTTVHRRNFGAAFGLVEIMDAVCASIGNLLIGYLRDRTGSYRCDMYLLLSLACVTLVLSLILLCEDYRNGQQFSARRGRNVSIDDTEYFSGSTDILQGQYVGSDSGSADELFKYLQSQQHASNTSQIV